MKYCHIFLLTITLFLSGCATYSFEDIKLLTDMSTKKNVTVQISTDFDSVHPSFGSFSETDFRDFNNWKNDLFTYTENKQADYSVTFFTEEEISSIDLNVADVIFNPFVTIFSLGIIPSHMSENHALFMRLKDNKTNYEVEKYIGMIHESVYFSWLFLPFPTKNGEEVIIAKKDNLISNIAYEINMREKQKEKRKKAIQQQKKEEKIYYNNLSERFKSRTK